MNIIKRGVAVADGWILCDGFIMLPDDFHEVSLTGDHYDEDHRRMPLFTQMHKDALAAQLVRQVDALDEVEVDCHPGVSYCREFDGLHRREVEARGNDRTMNTITCIVESGVLE